MAATSVRTGLALTQAAAAMGPRLHWSMATTLTGLVQSKWLERRGYVGGPRWLYLDYSGQPFSLCSYFAVEAGYPTHVKSSKGGEFGDYSH